MAAPAPALSTPLRRINKNIVGDRPTHLVYEFRAGHPPNAIKVYAGDNIQRMCMNRVSDGMKVDEFWKECEDIANLSKEEQRRFVNDLLRIRGNITDEMVELAIGEIIARRKEFRDRHHNRNRNRILNVEGDEEYNAPPQVTTANYPANEYDTVPFKEDGKLSELIKQHVYMEGTYLVHGVRGVLFDNANRENNVNNSSDNSAPKQVNVSFWIIRNFYAIHTVRGRGLLLTVRALFAKGIIYHSVSGAHYTLPEPIKKVNSAFIAQVAKQYTLFATTIRELVDATVTIEGHLRLESLPIGIRIVILGYYRCITGWFYSQEAQHVIMDQLTTNFWINRLAAVPATIRELAAYECKMSGNIFAELEGNPLSASHYDMFNDLAPMQIDSSLGDSYLRGAKEIHQTSGNIFGSTIAPVPTPPVNPTGPRPKAQKTCDHCGNPAHLKKECPLKATYAKAQARIVFRTGSTTGVITKAQIEAQKVAANQAAP